MDSLPQSNEGENEDCQEEGSDDAGDDGDNTRRKQTDENTTEQVITEELDNTEKGIGEKIKDEIMIKWQEIKYRPKYG